MQSNDNARILQLFLVLVNTQNDNRIASVPTVINKNHLIIIFVITTKK